uniref:Metalloendopeptidase n=1 Tax=Globodera rostochiensis TaxID=31243 RepID=A0A914GQ37_GLORO
MVSNFDGNCTTLFFIIVAIFQHLKGDPMPIDLAEQHGPRNRHGHGDVIELWEENQRDPKMRNALRNNATNRWTTQRDAKDGKFVIPYQISGNFSQSELEVIFMAMQKIARNTCVKFQSKRNRGDEDFVDIQNEYGEGCFTSVGRSPGRNILMLEGTVGETCVTDATVLHELFHKLGLWHEHMRSDRDKFIRVQFRNIPFYLHAQFRTVTTEKAITYGVRYDYRSLMQYGPNAFARPSDALSIKTRKRKFQKVIGTAVDASRGDWIKICAIYRCSECMGHKFDLAKESEQYREEEDGDETTLDEEENGARAAARVQIRLLRAL